MKRKKIVAVVFAMSLSLSIQTSVFAAPKPFEGCTQHPDENGVPSYRSFGGYAPAPSKSQHTSRWACIAIGSLATIFWTHTPTPNHGMQMKRRYIQLTIFTLNADYMKTTLYTAVQKMNKKMQLQQGPMSVEAAQYRQNVKFMEIMNFDMQDMKIGLKSPMLSKL